MENKEIIFLLFLIPTICFTQDIQFRAWNDSTYNAAVDFPADVTGHILLNNKRVEQNTTVNISNYLDGLYYIQFYEDGALKGTKSFVKF